jgi:hypothetical protein
MLFGAVLAWVELYRSKIGPLMVLGVTVFPEFPEGDKKIAILAVRFCNPHWICCPEMRDVSWNLPSCYNFSDIVWV